MRVQIDHSEDAGLGLESEHPLIVGLVLPGTAVNQIHTLVGLRMVTVNVAGDEDVGNFLNDESVFRFRGKGVAQLRGSRRGDQLVTIDVRIPSKLSTEQKDLLVQLSQVLPDVEQEEGEGIFSKFKNAFGA